MLVNSSNINQYNSLKKESLIDLELKKAKEKVENGRAQYKFGCSISYNSSSDMALLANAESISAVRALQNSIRVNIKMVRSSGADKSEIDKVIRMMNGVLKKADVKIGRLKKEVMLKEQEIGTRNSKLKNQIKEELKRKKKGRKAIENSQIASIENVACGTASDEAKSEVYKMQSSDGSNTVEVNEVIPAAIIDTTVSTAEGSDSSTNVTVDVTV